MWWKNGWSKIAQSKKQTPHTIPRDSGLQILQWKGLYIMSDSVTRAQNSGKEALKGGCGGVESRAMKSGAAHVHANIELFSILVNVVAPHVVAKHNLFDDGDEVVRHTEADNGEERAEYKIVDIVLIVSRNLVIEGCAYCHQRAQAEKAAKSSHPGQ